MGTQANLAGKDRLIVALDVPTIDEALDVVRRLDNVTFFKVGWQLFMSVPGWNVSFRRPVFWIDFDSTLSMPLM